MQKVAPIALVLLISTTGLWAQVRMIDLEGTQFRVFHNDLTQRQDGQPVLVFENGWGTLFYRREV